MGTLLLFALIPLFKMLAEYWLRLYGAKWRLRPQLYDPAAIVLLMLCVEVFSLPLTPPINMIFRYIEHRADAYSLGVVRDRVGLAEAFVALSEQDMDDPNPPLWEKIWFGNHPPLGERIDYALNGQPNQ